LTDIRKRLTVIYPVAIPQH